MKFNLCTPKNILVLGATGYLGVKLIKALSLQKFNIFATKRKNPDISRLASICGLNFVDPDISEIRNLLEINEFQIIVNLSCNYGRTTSLYGDVIEANIVFPLDVLNITSEYGIKTFITVDTALSSNFNMYSFSKNIFSLFGNFYSEKKYINYLQFKVTNVLWL